MAPPTPSPRPTIARVRAGLQLALQRPPLSRRAALAGGLTLYLLAFAVRSLFAVDLAPVMYTGQQPGTRMAARFDESAQLIMQGEGILFPRNPDPTQTGLLARPPGYPVFMVAVYQLTGRTYFGLQLVQNAINSFGPVLLFLLGARVLGALGGWLAGATLALSAQQAYASNFLVADTLVVTLLLLAMVVLAGARRRAASGEVVLHRVVWRAVAAGAVVGVTSWLRPNTMLLGFFLAAGLVALCGWRRPSWHAALLLIATSLGVMAPITLRNWIVFREFVPISINGGITLWQGVAAAGGQKYGAKQRDRLVAQDEALWLKNEAYGDWWAYPDGIERDRRRYQWATAVIRENPGWYAKAMAGRMVRMLDYEEGAPLIAEQAPYVPEGATQRPVLDSAAPFVPPPRSSNLALLWPGRVLDPLRGPLRVLQMAAVALAHALLFLGVPLLLLADFRGTAFLLSLPVYYFVFESMFILEWRVALPMQGPLFLLGAVPIVFALGALAHLRRPGAGSPGPRSSPA